MAVVLRNFLVPLFVVGILSACGANSNSELMGASTDPSPPVVGGSPAMKGDDAGADADASTKKTVGSPLCKRAASDCNPDAPTACAGSDDAGVPNAAISCRVSKYSTDGPECAMAGDGKDGATCSTSSECAAGFECVDEHNGAHRCRHYCCDGVCDAPGTGNKKMYCAIGAALGTKVPVCVPVTACQLLTMSACPSGETCSVVRTDGTTSCIPVGPQLVGEGCDRDNCAAGLSCIGNAGARKCYKLCREAAAEDCGAGERCVGGPPLFKEGFGLCAPAAGRTTMP